MFDCGLLVLGGDDGWRMFVVMRMMPMMTAVVVAPGLCLILTSGSGFNQLLKYNKGTYGYDFGDRLCCCGRRVRIHIFVYGQSAHYPVKVSH